MAVRRSERAAAAACGRLRAPRPLEQSAPPPLPSFHRPPWRCAHIPRSLDISCPSRPFSRTFPQLRPSGACAHDTRREGTRERETSPRAAAAPTGVWRAPPLLHTSPPSKVGAPHPITLSASTVHTHCPPRPTANTPPHLPSPQRRTPPFLFARVAPMAPPYFTHKHSAGCEPTAPNTFDALPTFPASGTGMGTWAVARMRDQRAPCATHGKGVQRSRVKRSCNRSLTRARPSISPA